MHLDSFLEYSEKLFGPVPSLVYTNDIDEYSGAESTSKPAVEGCWRFYKKIRGMGLASDQVGILLRKFQLDMSLREIQQEMGFTSYGSLYRRYRDALDTLKREGFEG